MCVCCHVWNTVSLRPVASCCYGVPSSSCIRPHWLSSLSPSPITSCSRPSRTACLRSSPPDSSPPSAYVSHTQTPESNILFWYIWFHRHSSVWNTRSKWDTSCFFVIELEASFHVWLVKTAVACVYIYIFYTVLRQRQYDEYSCIFIVWGLVQLPYQNNSKR